MAVNMLVSYAYFAKENIGALRAGMPCGRLLIDSGAFTAHSTGKVIRLEEYAEFLETWAGKFDHAVTLDVIGDPAATARNTKVLHKRGIPVMPVFTRGGKPADFDAMIRDVGYVCVGGGVGMPQSHVIARLSALQRRAEELGGGIHALGVGNMAAIRRIRPYSADASNIAGTFVYGTLVIYDGYNLRHFPHTDRQKVRKYARELAAQSMSGLLADMIRTRRMPTGEGRARLVRCLMVAQAAADEDTVRYNVPVPHGLNDSPGTHLYAAIPVEEMAVTVSKLDGELHRGEWTTPLWDRYRTRHTAHCRANQER